MPNPANHRADPPRLIGGEIEVRSAAFNDHTLIPDRYSYEGGNVSPPLEWGGIPDGTEELALLCEDPDAPRGAFTHWVVTNISPGTTGVGDGALPEGGAPGRNGFGKLGWGGPRPPVGDKPHRYFFRLYAANRPLDLGVSATAEQVYAALDGHTLGCGTPSRPVRSLTSEADPNSAAPAASWLRAASHVRRLCS